MTDRIYSIDTVRAVAMAFIVAIHADSFRGLGAYGNAANFVIDTTGRFAVPFFFLTAGYLFARNCDRDGYVGSYLARIVSIYGRGLALYFPLVLLVTAGTAARTGRDVSSAVLARFVDAVSPLGLFYYGDSVLLFLWFLPALAISIALVYGFVALEAERYLLPIAIGFHVVGLLGQSYTMMIDVPVPTRDALFFGFFYASLGYCLRSWEWTPAREHSGRYLAATVAFATLHLAERYVLGYVLTGDSIGQTVYASEYSVTTALFSTALFAFVLSRPNLGRGTRLPAIGSRAVSIYILHPLVLFALAEPVGTLEVGGYALENTVVWHLTLAPTVYFGALGLSQLAAARADAIRQVGRVASSGFIRLANASERK